MAFSDIFEKTINNQINTSITQVRSSTSNRLTDFITGALPKTNKIPGATGALVQREITKRVGDGVNQVLSVLQIPTDTKVIGSNPKIYANGTTAAKEVWTEIESGNKNVSSIVSKTLEPLTLLKHTDLAINNASLNYIDSLSTSRGKDSATVGTSPRYSPYAMDLFRLAPKHKFLFVCEFVFNGGYGEVGQGKTTKNEFALVIKDFEKPKIKYDYDANVNYYNFRTPIVKRVLHEPLVIKFLDDRQNISLKFFHEYLKATHPLTNVPPESSDFYEDNGMNWNSDISSASSGVLTNNLRTIIKEIKVYHLYDFGAYMNIYHFTNPKIIEMSLDNWNMHESDGSELTAAFGYDGLYIEMGVKVDKAADTVVATLSNAGQYPMHPMQVDGKTITVQPSTKLDARGIDPATVQKATNKIGTAQSAADEAARKAANLKASLDEGDEVITGPFP